MSELFEIRLRDNRGKLLETRTAKSYLSALEQAQAWVTQEQNGKPYYGRKAEVVECASK